MKKFLLSIVFLWIGLVQGSIKEEEERILPYRVATTLPPDPLHRVRPASLHTDNLKIVEATLTIHSLETQFIDLRLIDDPTGLGKLMGRIDEWLAIERVKQGHPNKVDVINPYFFRVDKAGECFFLLGSLHCLPLETLPPFVKKTIFNCDTLVIERSLEDPTNERWIEQLLSYAFSPGATYFERLSKKEKRLFSTVCTGVGSETPLSQKARERELSIEDFTSLALSEGYFSSHYERGMDFVLAEAFQKGEGKGRNLKWLETEEESAERLERARGEGPEEHFKTFQWLLTASFKNNAVGEEEENLVGGFLNCKAIWTRVTNYLQGQHTWEEDDPVVIEDNQRWYPRILELSKANKYSSMTIMIGAAHLSGAQGVLYRLITEGGFSAFRYHTRQGWVQVIPQQLLRFPPLRC